MNTLCPRIQLFLFVFIATLSLFGQQYNFQSLTIEQGLPQSTVYEIFQDSHGYIWFGTDGGGVARFDGENFHVYNKNNGLAGNVVRTICEDQFGNLWFGTDEGISFFDGIEFQNFNTEKGLPSNIILSLHAAFDAVWAGTSQGGLIKFSQKDSIEFQVFTNDNGLTSNNIFSISHDEFNRLWLGTFGGGLNAVSFKNDSISEVSSYGTHNILRSDHYLSINKFGKKKIVAGSYNRGIAIVDFGKNIDSPEVLIVDNTNGLGDNRIWSVLDDGEYTYIGTDNAGVQIVSRILDVEYLNTNNGLPKNQIIKVFKDDENSLWFSVFDEGVFRYQGKKFIHYTKKEGLKNADINAIASIDENKFWLGTDGDGLYYFDKANLSIQQFNEKNGLPSVNVTDLVLDSEKHLWISTLNGISYFNGKTFSNVSNKEGLLDNRVNTIYVDSKNQIWCGTSNGMNYITDETIFEGNLGEGLINEIQTIVEDQNGTIWCGTLGGIVEFNKDYMRTYDQEEGLDDLKVNALTFDVAYNLWIGTFSGGVYRMDNKRSGEEFIQNKINDSQLNSNNIQFLIFENDSVLLVGTDKGLNKVYLNKNQDVKLVRSFGKKEGFTGIENNMNAITKVGESFMMGTVNGLTLYNPEHDFISQKAPKVQINKLRLSFEEVDWQAKGFALIPWSNLPKDLVLPHKENHLTFTFSGLYYRNNKKVLFRYKLEGLDEKWSPPLRNQDVTFPGIAPGEYTFKVKASNEDGVWSEEPTSYSFYIKPPFWKTIWFYILCVIFIIVSIVFYIKYRERVLREEKERLEHLVQERTKEVVAQKKEIEEKNEHITASIKYAQRIQQALLPTENELKENVSEFFILYRPRDIVSGDFYWIDSKDKKLIVTAADCTGHGVPGAFMSMLGISFLNEIVNKNDITDSDIILNHLRQNVIDALKQTGDHDSQKDGMDMALISLDFETKIMQFSGANNPLFLIRDGELKEYKADKMPVAIHMKLLPFQRNEIVFKEGDKLYMFSDGYIDQFGGPNDRKFMKKAFKKLLLETNHLSMYEQKEHINKVIEDWMAKTEQIDDIVVIGIKI